MKSIIIIFSVFTTVTFSNLIYAGERSEWYFNNYEKIETILSAESGFIVIPVITTLGEIWRHSGYHRWEGSQHP